MLCLKVESAYFINEAIILPNMWTRQWYCLVNELGKHFARSWIRLENISFLAYSATSETKEELPWNE